ncbi:MAG: hypothetical protein HKL98_05100 [Burkholderiales bacterium]|nr:hypothetical protein [Burkholderiales bacterium]
MTRILLFIGDRNCQACVWKNGLLSDRENFPNSEEGRKAFARYLSRLPDPEVSILVDLVEEDYRIETLPPLKGRDRKLLEERKLEQFYRYTPLRNASRQNGQVLFSALTSPGLVVPWIELMTGMGIAVSCVTSVAMLSERLASNLNASHLLLLSIQEGTGLRQSFFLQGNLHFSRLALIHPGEDVAEVIRVESGRVYKYLHTLSLIPEKGALQVFVLCGEGIRKQLEQNLENTASIHHVFFDVAEAARRLGYHGKAEGNDALPLYFQILGSSPENRYGSEGHRRVHALKNLQRRAMAISAAFVFAGLIWGAVDVGIGMKLHLEAGLTAARTDAMLLKYRKMMPAQGSVPQRMKTAVTLVDGLSARFPPPEAVLSQISRALGSMDEIRIDRVVWMTTANPGKIRQPPSEMRAEQGIYAEKALSRVIFVEGEIAPFDGDFRLANEKVDRFVTLLEKQGIEVGKIRMPLDLDPATSFTGKAGDADKKPDFLLRMVEKGKS